MSEETLAKLSSWVMDWLAKITKVFLSGTCPVLQLLPLSQFWDVPLVDADVVSSAAGQGVMSSNRDPPKISKTASNGIGESNLQRMTAIAAQ